MPADPPAASSVRPAKPGRWLAIETSGLFGSVAAGVVTAEAGEVVALEPLPRDARSARTLSPRLQALLERLGWPPDSLAAVAVASGPGSFTGLRVGVTTAKALAWGTGAAVVGIDTLDALAETASPPSEGQDRLWTALDAQRGELFVARFVADGDLWRRDTPTGRMTREALDAERSPNDRVVGPSAAPLGGEPAEPQADGVLRVARRRWLAGGADSVFALSPQYHRRSAAEEKLHPPE